MLADILFWRNACKLAKDFSELSFGKKTFFGETMDRKIKLDIVINEEKNIFDDGIIRDSVINFVLAIFCPAADQFAENRSCQHDIRIRT